MCSFMVMAEDLWAVGMRDGHERRGEERRGDGRVERLNDSIASVGLKMRASHRQMGWRKGQQRSCCCCVHWWRRWVTGNRVQTTPTRIRPIERRLLWTHRLSYHGGCSTTLLGNVVQGWIGSRVRCCCLVQSCLDMNFIPRQSILHIHRTFIGNMQKCATLIRDIYYTNRGEYQHSN